MKKIKFSAEEDYLSLPITAKRFLPDWYKNIPSNVGRKRFRLTPDGVDLGTLKRCMPFLDAMTAGYMVSLWQDLQVTQIDGVPQLNWPTQPGVAAVREKSHSQGFQPPAGHSDVSLSWTSPYIVKTPPGYSSIITHPFNRYDLPFTTASGIVDTDSVLHQGRFPFFLKEGFEGIIEKGTPIFQIVPFKRESWESESDRGLLPEALKSSYDNSSVLRGHYRMTNWHKKEYRDGFEN